MPENLRWEHPRRPHDFHSSWEGAPNPRRLRRDAQRSALTVERWSPRRCQPAMLRGVLILSMLPLAKSPAPGSRLLQTVRDGQLLEDTSGKLFACTACKGAVRYCGQSCQRTAWAVHKLVCSPHPLRADG